MININTIKASASLFAVAVAVAVPLTASAAELVSNGGFETGDFTNWIQSGNTAFNGVATGVAHSGTYGAFFGPIGSIGAIRQQSLATVIGQSYDISFWLQSDGATPNAFAAMFGADTLVSSINLPSFPYTQYTFTRVATSNSTVLSFAFRDDPGFLYLDDVSVKDSAGAVPEPGTWATMLLGFGLIGGAMRSRKRRQPQVRFAL